MNLRFIAILLLSLTGFHSGLCQFSWMLEFKPDGYYSGAESLSIDTDNNVVVVGNFNEGITLAENHYTGFGSFVIKLTSNGVPLWHKIIRSSLPEFASVSHIHIDQYNNIYIGGGYSGTVTIDNSQLSSGYPYNSFVAKLDTDGQVIWQKNIPNVQEIFDMKGNIHGDILLYSLHFGTVVIDNIQAEVGPNSFGVLLNASGEVQWIKPFGERLQYTTWPKACAIDETGNTYFHGIFSGTLQADGKQVTSTGGNYDFFFARVNPSGTCDWLRSAERKISQFETSTPPSGLIVERGAIAVDDSGNLYGGGNFWEGIKLGSLNLSGSGQFVLKLKNDGTPEWIKRKTNSNNSTVDDIIVKNNKVYIGGILPSQVYIDVYTSGGDVVEAISVPVFADIASGLGVDTYDSIYFSGRRYDNDKLTAFVFKYGAKAILPLPQPAGDITEPMVFCPPDATLLVKTSAIGGASSYEWEITFNNAIITLVSDNSEIEIVTEDLGITGDFSVRVRGLNETGYGPYSPIHVLKAETILPAPDLFASCNTVFTNEDNQSVQWYLNNQVLSGVENTTSIQPTGNGNYHITISNTCGVVKSNEIDFQTLMPESIFMPNIITPNDDDINEYLILDEKLESPRLKVFNRWGKIIYSAEEYTNQWNGADVPSGVYFYLVYSTCLSKPIQGTLTIVR